mgnify:CR=1 FL=1
MSGIALDANLLMKFACVKRVCFMVVRFGKSAVELQRPLHLGSDMSFDQDLVTSIDIASGPSITQVGRDGRTTDQCLKPFLNANPFTP